MDDSSAEIRADRIFLAGVRDPSGRWILAGNACVLALYLASPWQLAEVLVAFSHQGSARVSAPQCHSPWTQAEAHRWGSGFARRYATSRSAYSVKLGGRMPSSSRSGVVASVPYRVGCRR